MLPSLAVQGQQAGLDGDRLLMAIFEGSPQAAMKALKIKAPPGVTPGGLC